MLNMNIRPKSQSTSALTSLVIARLGEPDMLEANERNDALFPRIHFLTYLFLILSRMTLGNRNATFNGEMILNEKRGHLARPLRPLSLIGNCNATIVLGSALSSVNNSRLVTVQKGPIRRTRKQSLTGVNQSFH
jgi:hypothetical protein